MHCSRVFKIWVLFVSTSRRGIEFEKVKNGWLEMIKWATMSGCTYCVFFSLQSLDCWCLWIVLSFPPVIRCLSFANGHFIFFLCFFSALNKIPWQLFCIIIITSCSSRKCRFNTKIWLTPFVFKIWIFNLSAPKQQYEKVFYSWYLSGQIIKCAWVIFVCS